MDDSTNTSADSRTRLFSVEEFEKSLISSTIKDVYDALTEKGYNATNQLIGYIMSGDSGYISSYNNARDKIMTLDRSKILEVIVSEYVSNL